MYSATKDETISGAKNSAQAMRDEVSGSQADLRMVANKAGRKVRDFIHTASDEITHAKDTVATQIRTNPVQSSLIALGVGVVLGALFRRS